MSFILTNIEKQKDKTVSLKYTWHGLGMTLVRVGNVFLMIWVFRAWTFFCTKVMFLDFYKLYFKIYFIEIEYLGELWEHLRFLRHSQFSYSCYLFCKWCFWMSSNKITNASLLKFKTIILCMTSFSQWEVSNWVCSYDFSVFTLWTLLCDIAPGVNNSLHESKCHK